MLGAVILQVILIGLNAIFASAEIAVISMSDVKLSRMAEEGDKRARRLVALTAQPARFLATIQVSITLAGFLGSAYAADNFATPLVAWLIRIGVPVPQSVLQSVCVLLITVVIAYFSIVFGELIPKRVAMQRKEQIAMGISGILYTVAKVFRPLVALLTGSTNLVLKLMRINADQEEEVTEEEIRMMLAAGQESGTIDSDENTMIQNVFELDDRSVENVCTHRKDVIALDYHDSVEEWHKIINDVRHNCLPVYKDSLDDVIGVLDVKSYYRLKDKSKKNIMKHAVKEPYFVSDYMKTDALLRGMQKRGEYFAVAIDEYGGVSGVVSIKDLMEVLLGELPDEDGGVSNDIIPMDNGRFLIRGNQTLEDISAAIGLQLYSEQYETFNGLICDLLGGVPTRNSRKRLETERMIIDVREVKNFCVEQAVITVKEQPESGAEA